MSTTFNAVACLVLAATIAFLAGAASNFVNLPQPIGLWGACLTFLLLSYPAMQRWNGSRLHVTFGSWALRSIVIVGVSALLSALIF